MKKCTKCKKPKSLEFFHVRPSASDGRNSICKRCDGKKIAAWRKKNKEKWRAYCRGRYYKDKASGKLDTLKSRHPLQRAAYRRKHRYGITQDQIIKMLNKQKHKCPVCLNELNDKNMFAVDHCHKTGLVRGLLCGKCNWGLGSLMDSVENLKRAAKYLENCRMMKGRAA
jgi:hypothetical protein